jgi:cysteine sulfinate desulfinase/cysteine desulfurase-like protein
VYQSTLRFSVGLENTEQEIDDAVLRISDVVGRLRSQPS